MFCYKVPLMKTNIALREMLHTGLVAIVAFFSVSEGLRAVVLDFDPPTYTSGTTVIGQDSWRWMTSGGSDPNSIATVVSTASAISSPNVMQVAGSLDGTGNYGMLFNTGPDGLYAGTSGVITFYYQQVVAPVSYAQAVSLYANDGAFGNAMTFEFGTPQNLALPGRLGYYNGGSDPVYTSTNIFDSSATGDWFQFTVNFTATSYDLNVVNLTDSATVLGLTGLQYRNGGSITTNIYGMTILAYDGVSYYDSISITAVPEVSSMSLALAGCFGLVFGRKLIRSRKKLC